MAFGGRGGSCFKETLRSALSWRVARNKERTEHLLSTYSVTTSVLGTLLTDCCSRITNSPQTQVIWGSVCFLKQFSFVSKPHAIEGKPNSVPGVPTQVLCKYPVVGDSLSHGRPFLPVHSPHLMRCPVSLQDRKPRSLMPCLEHKTFGEIRGPPTWGLSSPTALRGRC